MCFVQQASHYNSKFCCVEQYVSLKLQLCLSSSLYSQMNPTPWHSNSGPQEHRIEPFLHFQDCQSLTSTMCSRLVTLVRLFSGSSCRLLVNASYLPLTRNSRH